MKRLKAWTAISAMALLGLRAAAQDPSGSLEKQLADLRARMLQNESELKSIKSENAELKARLDGGANGTSALETEINRLQDCCDPCNATVVHSGANPVTLGGEFRFRRYTSLGDNIVTPKVPPDGISPGFNQDEHDGHWTDARVRLNFRYDFPCDVSAYAELQTHWAFGDDPTGPIDDWNGSNTVGDVGMYQAWLETRNMFCRRELSARVGRQEIVFGNQFQFGNADWYNGVVFDGGRVDWTTKCWTLTGLMLKLSSIDGDINQISSFRVPHDDDELYGAYLTLTPNKCTTIDFYWLYVNGHGGASGQRSVNSGANAGFGNNPELGFPGVLGFLYPGSEAYWHTFGARIGGTLNLLCGVDYNLEGAYQTGDVHDLELTGEDVDVDAFTVEGELGVTLEKPHHVRVFGRALFAEGPEDGDVGYLILYPNRHSNTGFRARYGLADLIPMTNVFTAQLGAHFDPFCNWTFGATGLWATTDNPVGDGLDDDYGTELDLWGEWRYSKQLTFAGGVALVWPDDQGEILWGISDETQVIAYLQARLWF
jgi:hypothetical protein